MAPVRGASDVPIAPPSENTRQAPLATTGDSVDAVRVDNAGQVSKGARQLIAEVANVSSINALSGGIDTSKPSAALLGTWNGPILTDGDEENEKLTVRGSGGNANIAVCGTFDARLPPVLLVHGAKDSPKGLTALAEHYRKLGRQVMFACYDDQDTPLSVTGAALAAALLRVQALYPPNTRLEVVTHSFGGPTAFAMLDSLALANCPAAGFSSIDIQCVDAPWHGFGWDWFRDIPILGLLLVQLIHLGFWLANKSAMYDLWVGGAISDLHSVPLERVRVHLSPLQQRPEERDDILWVHDLSRRERRAVVEFLNSDRLPYQAGLRNLCLTLARDERFPKLKEAAKRGLKRGEGEAQLVSWVESVIPSTEAPHSPVVPSMLDR